VNLPFLRGLCSYLISLTSLTKFGSRRESLMLGEAIDANCGPVAAFPTAVNPTVCTPSSRPSFTLLRSSPHLHLRLHHISSTQTQNLPALELWDSESLVLVENVSRLRNALSSGMPSRTTVSATRTVHARAGIASEAPLNQTSEQVGRAGPAPRPRDGIAHVPTYMPRCRVKLHIPLAEL
jgi:hypothetical protein